MNRRTALGLLATTALSPLSGCSLPSWSSDNDTANSQRQTTSNIEESFRTTVAADLSKIFYTAPEIVVGSLQNEATDRVAAYDSDDLTRIGSFSPTPDQSIGGLLGETVLAHDEEGTTAVSITDGEERWQSPIQLVPFQQGPGDSFLLFEQNKDGPTDTVVRLDTKSWTVSWRAPRLHDLATWGEDHVLFSPGADSTEAICHDARTGRRLWRRMLPDDLEFSTGLNGLRVGDALVLANRKRVDVVGYDDGTHRGEYTPPSTLKSQWAVADDSTIVLGSRKSLGVVGIGTDENNAGIQWTLDSEVDAARPVGVNEVVYVNVVSDRQYSALGIDPTTGSVQWRHPGTIVAVDDTGAYISDGATLAAVSDDGTRRWWSSHDLSGGPTSDLDAWPTGFFDRTAVRAVDDRLLVVGDEGFVVYDASDGSERLRVEALLNLHSVVLQSDENAQTQLFAAFGDRIGVVEV